MKTLFAPFWWKMQNTQTALLQMGEVPIISHTPPHTKRGLLLTVKGNP